MPDNPDPRQRTQKVPLLFNGISTQPPTARLPSHVADALNVNVNVYDGLTRRPGTWVQQHVAAGLLPAANNRLVGVVRDETERYLVVHNRTAGEGAVVRVLELSTNLWANVTVSADAQGYLDAASPDEFIFRTVADTTIIVNTDKALGFLPGPDYLVGRSHDRYEVMLTFTPADEAYHQTENDSIEAAGFYQYDVGGVTFPTAQFSTLTSATYTTPTGIWNDSANAPRGFLIHFREFDTGAQTGATYNAGTNTLTKTGAFAGWTFVAGRYLRVTGDGGSGTVVAGFRAIASKVSDDAVTLVDDTGFTGSPVDVTFDGIATRHDVSMDAVDAADMDGVALALTDALRAAGATDGLVSWTQTATEEGYFTITGPTRGAPATIYAPTAGSAFDLTQAGFPFDPASVSITAGAGSGSASLAPDERWTRVVAPGQSDALLDPETMPVKLVRDSVGSLPSTPAEFSIDLIDWNPRLSGSSVTNPLPDVWAEGYKIADFRYWKGRMWIYAGEWAVSTQAGDLFNFWIENVNVLVDSDPIRVELSSDKVTRIRHAVPIRDSTILFTEAGVQFEFSSGDALTPTSVKAKPITRYLALAVEPEVLDPNVFFMVKAGDAAHLLEYSYDEVSLPSTAEDVSSHTPNLIPLTVAVPDEYGNFDALPSEARRLCVSPEHGVVFVLRRDQIEGGEVFGTEVFVYRMHHFETKKVQSAWVRWEIEGVRGIHDIAVVGNTLYLLVHCGTDSPPDFFILGVSIPAEAEGVVAPDNLDTATTTEAPTTTA